MLNGALNHVYGGDPETNSLICPLTLDLKSGYFPRPAMVNFDTPSPHGNNSVGIVSP